MAEEALTSPAAAPIPDPVAAAEPPVAPALAMPARGGIGRVLAAMALAFVLGFAIAFWVGWQNGADWTRVLGGQRGTGTAATPEWSAAPGLVPVEARVATLEARLDTLDRRADAAAGNAGRAEALLIAFATRRAIERGAPLGYLEDQLKLRFGDALPNAVATIGAAARNPVTLDQLALGLDSLAAEAGNSAGPASGWERMRREISGLFVIHSGGPPAPANPAQRIAQARLLLREGRIDDAIANVRALPLASREEWIAGAARYQQAERALDLIETTALVEPRELNDSAGRKVPLPASAPVLPTPAPVASSVAGH